MSALPKQGAQTLGARLYEALERFAPWKYTGIYSTPEFKSHVPDVSDRTRISPTNPPFSTVLTKICNAMHLVAEQCFADAALLCSHYGCRLPATASPA